MSQRGSLARLRSPSPLVVDWGPNLKQLIQQCGDLIRGVIIIPMYHSTGVYKAQSSSLDPPTPTDLCSWSSHLRGEDPLFLKPAVHSTHNWNEFQVPSSYKNEVATMIFETHRKARNTNLRALRQSQRNPKATSVAQPPLSPQTPPLPPLTAVFPTGEAGGDWASPMKQ